MRENYDAGPIRVVACSLWVQLQACQQQTVQNWERWTSTHTPLWVYTQRLSNLKQSIKPSRSTPVIISLLKFSSKNNTYTNVCQHSCIIQKTIMPFSQTAAWLLSQQYLKSCHLSWLLQTFCMQSWQAFCIVQGRCLFAAFVGTAGAQGEGPRANAEATIWAEEPAFTVWYRSFRYILSLTRRHKMPLGPWYLGGKMLYRDLKTFFKIWDKWLALSWNSLLGYFPIGKSFFVSWLRFALAKLKDSSGKMPPSWQGFLLKHWLGYRTVA